MAVIGSQSLDSGESSVAVHNEPYVMRTWTFSDLGPEQRFVEFIEGSRDVHSSGRDSAGASIAPEGDITSNPPHC